MTQTAERKDAGRRSAGPAAAGDAGGNAAKTGRKSRGSRDRPSPTPSKTAASQRRDAIAIGSEPRVHLLPPEVVADRKAAVVRRRLGLGVVAVVLIMGLGIFAAGTLAASAQRDLTAEQATTQSLLTQQLSYVKVRAVQEQLALIQTAEQVGASTEIAWTPYLQKVQATLPPNVTITGVAVDSSTPIELYPQSTASLQGPRVATIVFTAKSPSLPEVPSWLLALKTLPGYADALPGSVTLDQSGAYTVTITMHVNEKAFSNRFSSKTEK
ncbi:hypothetical protein [Leifsonia xyli]|uniref:hypothetical protein n=1 Tax=Leifsonia xyli TaxID=1575 RepID=UPI003D669494